MFFKKEKVRKTEDAISVLLAVEKNRLRIPTVRNDGDTAVKLRVVYFFGHVSGTPKWKREQVTFMTQRPDADNLSKSLVDCMTKCGYWDDDSMVNFEFSKYRAPHPGIMIVLERWKQERESPENAMKTAQRQLLPNCSPTVSQQL